MERRNRLLTLYRVLVIMLGAGFLVLVGSSQGRESLALLFLFCLLAAGSEAARVPAGNGSFSLSSGVVLAALICLGVPAALWVAAAGYLLGGAFNRQLGLTSVFNAAQGVLAALAAAVPYHFLGGIPGGSSFIFLLPQAAFLGTYFLANHLLVGLAMVLEQGPAALWENRLLVGWDFLGTLLALPAGLFLAQVHEQVGPAALALAAVPLLTLSYIWQLYARVRAANQEVVALYAATSSIGASIDLDATLQEILQQARRLVQYEQGIVYLADDENLMPAAAQGPVPDLVRYRAVPVGQGLVGRVAVTRRPEAVPLSEEDDGEKGNARWNRVAVPLVTGERLVGVLALGRTRREFSERELQFLAILAGQAATALENARLYSEVAALARLDPLTGIYNRRALVEALTNELVRCRRYGLSLAVLMVDLDNFKNVNDVCGHMTGDAVLKKIAVCIASGVRNVDVVGRYGGDEIAILLPETGAAEAFHVAERIRRTVREITKDQTCQVTTSIGIATYPQHGEEATVLLAAADQAMYYAKRQGGDRVLTYAQLPPAVGAGAGEGGPCVTE